jgi:mannosyl-3-phosphoglycerate phosphatase
MKNIIVFTDLDGTLLDINTYSFSEARGAINELIRRKIPIVPCTSKTHLEVLDTQKKIGTNGPFIVENGSAIFFKKENFPGLAVDCEEMDGYQFLTLGSKYNEIIHFFNNWREKFSLSVTGFNEMSIEQVMKLTDLNYADAELARKRFFSEPFILNDNSTITKNACDDLRQNGFRLLQGNRFYHLLGNSDKGAAVKKVTEFYKKTWSVNTVTTIGIGDSMNDLEMLKVVDKPVLVKKADGAHQTGVEVNNLIRTDGIGPAGWQEAIFKLLD